MRQSRKSGTIKRLNRFIKKQYYIAHDGYCVRISAEIAGGKCRNLLSQFCLLCVVSYVPPEGCFGVRRHCGQDQRSLGAVCIPSPSISIQKNQLLRRLPFAAVFSAPFADKYPKIIFDPRVRISLFCFPGILSFTLEIHSRLHK